MYRKVTDCKWSWMVLCGAPSGNLKERSMSLSSSSSMILHLEHQHQHQHIIDDSLHAQLNSITNYFSHTTRDNSHVFPHCFDPRVVGVVLYIQSQVQMYILQCYIPMSMTRCHPITEIHRRVVRVSIRGSQSTQCDIKSEYLLVVSIIKEYKDQCTNSVVYAIDETMSYLRSGTAIAVRREDLMIARCSIATSESGDCMICDCWGSSAFVLIVPERCSFQMLHTGSARLSLSYRQIGMKCPWTHLVSWALSFNIFPYTSLWTESATHPHIARERERSRLFTTFACIFAIYHVLFPLTTQFQR